MDAWNQGTHGRSGLIDRVKASTASEADVEAAALAFLLFALPAFAAPSFPKLTGRVVDEAQVHKGWVELEMRAEPKAENVELYSRLFSDYVALYPALKPIMHRLQGTSS